MFSSLLSLSWTSSHLPPSSLLIAFPLLFLSYVFAFTLCMMCVCLQATLYWVRNLLFFFNIRPPPPHPYSTPFFLGPLIYRLMSDWHKWFHLQQWVYLRKRREEKRWSAFFVFLSGPDERGEDSLSHSCLCSWNRQTGIQYTSVCLVDSIRGLLGLWEKGDAVQILAEFPNHQFRDRQVERERRSQVNVIFSLELFFSTFRQQVRDGSDCGSGSEWTLREKKRRREEGEEKEEWKKDRRVWVGSRKEHRSRTSYGWRSYSWYDTQYNIVHNIRYNNIWS